MIGVSIYGYLYGNPGKLLAGLDGDGNIFYLIVISILGNFCGYDSGYTDYPYLFIWNLDLPIENIDYTFLSAVCVKTCPTVDSSGVYSIDCVPTNYTIEKTGSTTSCAYTGTYADL
jgi:hypothetical protein